MNPLRDDEDDESVFDESNAPLPFPSEQEASFCITISINAWDKELIHKLFLLHLTCALNLH
jgi:hypothetical protein